MMDLAGFRQLGDLEVEGKCVFVRADFGVVPPTDDGRWYDDGTVPALVPTVTQLVQGGARVVIGASVRTASGAAPSLEPVASQLAEHLGSEVYLPDDCVGDARKLVLGNLRAGQVCLLENIAMHPEEAACDLGFAEQLGRSTELYVGDAVASLFERTTSMVELARLARGRAVGLHLASQLDVVARLRSGSRERRVAIVTADTAAQADAWVRALAGRVAMVCVVGVLAESLRRAGSARDGGDVEIAAARTLMARLDAAGTALQLVPTSPLSEVSSEQLADVDATLRSAALAVWVDCSARSAGDELQAGLGKLAELVAQLTGFTGVIGDALGVVLRRQCPHVLGQMNFSSTGGASLLKLVEGRRSVALERLGVPS